MDRDNILANIKILDPSIEATYTDEQIYLYIDMAMIIVAAEGSNLLEPEQELAASFLVLSYFSVFTAASNMSKKRLRDVEITYSDYGASSGAKTRWRKLYDDMISGESNSELTLHYTGV